MSADTITTTGEWTMTMTEFVERQRITIKATRIARNPQIDDSGDMDHWRVTLRYMPGQGGAITLPYSMGKGHHGTAPTAEDVLDCLASDASSYDQAISFEDWADDFGYDHDSRKAERTYRNIERQTQRLQAWLGLQYQTLLYNTERP